VMSWRIASMSVWRLLRASSWWHGGSLVCSLPEAALCPRDAGTAVGALLGAISAVASDMLSCDILMRFREPLRELPSVVGMVNGECC